MGRQAAVRVAGAAGVALALGVLGGCGAGSDGGDPTAPSATAPSAAAPSDPGGPTGDDGADLGVYCATVHRTFGITAEVDGDAVLVGWEAEHASDDRTTFTVYRRPAGAGGGSPDDDGEGRADDGAGDGGWERLGEVAVARGDERFVDTTPPAEPGLAYEYAVTVTVAECGGESEPCADRSCVPPAVAVPPSDDPA